LIKFSYLMILRLKQSELTKKAGSGIPIKY
jgi:hypothetical protein